MFFLFITWAFCFELDYKKANTNTRKYDQVPKNTLIISKFQAVEPMWMFEQPLRGRGHVEAFQNTAINKLRQSYEVYVDYFTVAKNVFYMNEKGYEICVISPRSIKEYKQIILDTKTNNNKHKFFNKYMTISIPLFLQPSLGTLVVVKEKANELVKHRYKNSEIINIKSLIDDEKLKTIQIKDISGPIAKHAYFTTKLGLSKMKPQYTRRIYEFVSSNAIQIALMIKNRRMDWADITPFSDYYIKKLGYSSDSLVLLEFSEVDPATLTIEDTKVHFYRCLGKDLVKLQKIVRLINETTKKYRTNLEFWAQVLKQYAIDVNIPYVSPEKFYFYRENFKLKKEIDNSLFDNF